MQNPRVAHWCLAVLMTGALLSPGRGRAAQKLTASGNHRLGVILDLRLAGAGRQQASRAGGLGLLRHGGQDESGAGWGDRGKLRASLGQLGLQFSGQWGRKTGYLLELNSQVDGHQRTALSVPEVFLTRQGRWGRAGLEGRFGWLIPPFSLEHPGVAWSTFFTLTPSAINTWIGEEVRGWGAEGKATLRLAQSKKASLTLATFAGNDPGGVLLSWRGWALHDLQAGFNDRTKFRGSPAVTNPAVFAMPQAFTRPFLEVDDRLGLYGNFRLDTTRARFTYGYWQNHADRRVFDVDHVYGWETFFHHLGGRYEPTHRRWLLQGQWLRGRTRMGAGQPAPVENDFAAWHVLASRPIGQDRASLRFDWFTVKDHDLDPGGDLNGQKGHALTLAWRHSLNNKADLVLEVVDLTSKRPMNTVLGQDETQHETQWQLAWRYYR